MNPFYSELKQLGHDIISTSVALFKIMIPMIIVIKIADEFGGIELLSSALEPLMSFVGLPSSMAIVWATTMLTNLYAGIVILIETGVSLNVAQATILASLMLLSHGLPIEGMISKKAGVPLWATLVVRIGGSIAFAWLQNVYYTSSNTNQHTAKILWESTPPVYESHLDWAIGQLENLVGIFVIIALLITLLRILKFLKVEHLMALIMMPLLKLLRVSKEAANLAVIGITLGLSYGGGLIISESKKGKLTKKDAFITVMLLNLLHSILEDTALVLLFGADLMMVLWGRILFSLVVMVIISYLYSRFEEKEKPEYSK